MSSRNRKKTVKVAVPKIAPPESKQVPDFVSQYSAKHPVYSSFTLKLKALLEDLLSVASIEFHVIESRTKNVQSFAEKITRANKRYADPMSEITDFSGLRIIVYYLEDLRTVEKLIQNEFKVDPKSSSDKGELLQPNAFGYRSVHYVVTLPGHRCDLAEWKSFKGLCAEIQVRTVLQHAWASLSHKLEYKRELEVPTPLRRKLSRLAGLMELSDEEFSALRAEEKILSGKVRKELEGGKPNLEINALSVRQYLKESDVVKQLVRDGKSAGFAVDKRDRKVSDLVSLCVDFGINTIEELESSIGPSKNWSKLYFSAVFSTKPREVTEWGLNDAFLVMLVLLHVLIKKVNVRYLIEKNWDKTIADAVLKAAKDFRSTHRKS